MHARDFTSSYYSFFHSHNHAKHIVFIYKESTYSFNLTAKVRPLYRYFFHIAFLGMSREGKRNQRLSVERICLTYISHDYFLFYGLLLAYTLERMKRQLPLMVTLPVFALANTESPLRMLSMVSSLSILPSPSTMTKDAKLSSSTYTLHSVFTSYT